MFQGLRLRWLAHSAVPEIRIRTLSPEDEFIVLACDGLWDVWRTSQRVIEEARLCLQQNNNDPQACAEFLVSALLAALLGNLEGVKAERWIELE